MSDETRQVVHSPEQVALHLPVTGPTTRILAYAIDATVVLLVQVAVWLGALFGLPALFERVIRPLVAFARGGNATFPSDVVLGFAAIALLLYWLVELGYFVLCETTTNGRSLGKGLLGLRVVRDGGFPIGLRESLIRNLLRAVDVLPGSYLVGLVAILLSRDAKRLGDLAAGTIVVRLDRPQPALPLPDLPPAARDVFRFDHAQVARIGPAEVTLLLETLRRLGSLEPDRAAAALERAANALATRIGHAPVAPHEQETFLRALLEAAHVR